MRPPRPGLDWLLMAGLYAVAVAARWPLLDVTPYGDEPLHYWVARHFQALPNVTDIHGLPWVHPDHIFWQRPAFYVGFHAFALGGFDSLRVGHVLVASLVPAFGYGLLRSHGAARAFALAAGLALCLFPVLVTWGVLAVMDTSMTLAFLGGLWARRVGRPILGASMLLVAVWMKETAFFPLAALAAWTAAGDWIQGRLRFRPDVSLPVGAAALLAASALALLPLFVAMSQGLQMPGAQAQGYGDRLLDTLFVSPWLIPVLVMGLAWPRSRPLAGIALFVAGFMLVYHVALHRAVEVWYLVLPVTLCMLGLASALDQAWRRTAAASAGPKAAAGLAVFAVGLLLAVAIAAPPGPEKAWATHPATRHADESLPGMYRFEHEVRDHHRDAAFAALGLDGSQAVVLVDVDYPQALQLSESAHRVYVDSAWFRTIFPVEMEGFARIVESNGTLLLARYTDFPFFHAINEAYGDCRVFDNGHYRVYEGWRCQGRLAVLEQGVHSRDPPIGS